MMTLVSILALAGACSEAADLSPDGGSDAVQEDGGGSDGGSTTTEDGGTKPGSDAGKPSGDAGNGAIVLNEVCGKGDNWIEVMNVGTAAIDVSGYGVCDSNKNDGGPKIDGAAVFPKGTILSPNSYLLVEGLQSDGGGACPDGGGESYCVLNDFGISNGDGEWVYLLAPDQSVMQSTPYPAGTLNDGQSWGRLPNGSGDFATATATPGAANH